MVPELTHQQRWEVLAAAEQFHTREGHLHVPRQHREGRVRLGVRLDTWRSARRAGTLDQAVLKKLDELGIVWEPRSRAEETNWSALTAYARRHRHLLPRQRENFDIGGQQVAVGRLMTEARRPGSGRAKEFDALGVAWRVEGPWGVAWQRHLALMDLYVADGGTVTELTTGSRPFGGEDLGAWLRKQLARWGELREQQRQVLTERGVMPAEPPRTRAQRRSRDERTQAAIEAARRHLQDVGPLVDDRARHAVRRDWQTSVDGMQVRLLARLNKARERRERLEESVLKQYAAWGLSWAAAELEQREA